jgi:hypothetical protein
MMWCLLSFSLFFAALCSLALLVRRSWFSQLSWKGIARGCVVCLFAFLSLICGLMALFIEIAV